MELVETKQAIALSSDQGSNIAETELSQSMLTVHSQSISETAQDEIENMPDMAPGNPLHIDLPEDGRSTPKKITVIDDEGFTSSVTSLKNFHKMQHGRQRKKRNKIAPTDFGELERPSSAPTNNRTRQWLKEINENRPMTAAPQLSREFVAPQPEKAFDAKSDQETEDHESLKDKSLDDANSTASSVKAENKETEPIQPPINETAYIPYEYARAMITRIVGDMNKMKSNHLSILSKMEEEYQKMEHQTQVQFNESISHLQHRQHKRVEHYRHIIEMLHKELQAKGSLRADVIQNLKERNKELALERKKIQQQLSKSHLQFVPVPAERRTQAEPKERRDSEVAAPEAQEAEEKVIEDTKETEKFPAEAIAAGVVAAAVKERLSDREEEEEEAEKLEKEEKKEEAQTIPLKEIDREKESDHDEEKVKSEADSDSEVEVLEDAGDEVAHAKEATDASMMEVPMKEKPSEAEKPTPVKKKPKKPKVPESVPPADQAQQNKQQAILAAKQAKRIKELERQLESERKRAEQSRKSAKNVDADLENAKNEVSTLKKSLAEQKAELARLEEQAGAGAIALQQLPELKDQVKSLTAENESLASNYNSERVLRKKYYNMVEDMKGKIRVYCRVRPLSKTERANKNKCAVFVPDEYTVKIESNRGGMKEFQFDEIFAETASQENIFEDTHSLIQSAVDGYNVCIFAYGQTGSGKTYTMIGDNDQKFPGIAPRAFDRIFDIVNKNKKKFTFKISCYMLELYNEKLVDLLSASKDEPAKLDIKKDNKGMVVIQGTEVLSANDPSELFNIFLKGSTNRHTASTRTTMACRVCYYKNLQIYPSYGQVWQLSGQIMSYEKFLVSSTTNEMNEDSSRSHLVIGIIIESTNLTSGAITRGKLSLVDLAGSERVAKTGATAQQLKEANSINKSLSALGDVISALSSEQSFIPYRNNKLTMLMQDSLGGNAKTLMFVNISPADYNTDESAISLTYASRVKLIKNDASKMADSKEVARLKQIIAKLKAGEQIED